MNHTLGLACIIVLFGLRPAPLSAQESTALGGYGEIHYTNQTGPGTPGQADLKRFVIYLAHSFDERLSFRSELEIEDAKLEAGSPAGEVGLEQAYLDYRLGDELTIRTGLVLPPIGIINETHEPPTFNGVNRPAFDHDVIPTTWREIGVGAVGKIPQVEGLGYRVYLVNGLRASGFSAEEGIREGRQEGQEASFANPSLTGRLEWAGPGLRVGASFWYGGSAEQDSAVGLGTFAAPVALLSADARYDISGFSLRGVAANITIRDARFINTRYGTAVGKRISGGYLEGAYNVLRALAPNSTQRLNLFARHERYDTHAAVPAGTVRDRSLARALTTFGVTYKPTFNTAFKGDYQFVRNRASTGEFDVLSFGIGYQF